MSDTVMATVSTTSATSRNRRILVVDDNPAIHEDFRKILGGAFRPGESAGDDLATVEASIFGAPLAGTDPKLDRKFDLYFASQGEEALELLRRMIARGEPPAVTFLDMRMPPGWDGLRTAKAMWEVAPELHVVICTAYSDHHWDAVTAQAISSDQLLVLKKPFESIEVTQLARALTQKWDQAKVSRLRTDELEALVQQRTAELRRMALHDQLTGLPNRVLFNDRLLQAIRRARRDPNFRYAVLFLDFDRFKVVNDSMGHEAGDALLRCIAERLRELLRAGDTIARETPEGGQGKQCTAARLGGDEFCVLLEGITADHDAARVADRILHALAKPFIINGREVHSSASIGITTSSIPYERAEDVVRDADNAMYRAKAAGKGRFVLFDQRMHADALKRLTIESDLRRAIERNQFRLFFQPIVSLETGMLTGFEGLIRWEHPDCGMMPPAEFVELAEETGFIIEMGDWVIAQACNAMARWRRLYPTVADNLTISVNVSRKHLVLDRLHEHVAQCIAGSGVPADRLILEITESCVMQDAAKVIEQLQMIRKAGAQIFIDDFGAGYSSLSCLHQLPLNGMKIDRAFIRDATGRREYVAVIHAIITLARSLNLQMVAEGVESLEQVALLQAIGCPRAQGFFFSKAVSLDAAEAMILENRRMAA